MNKPAAHRNHPINAVLRPDEPFRELARKVEYCEITWPQSYEMGEPIQMMTDLETSIIDAACSLLRLMRTAGVEPNHLDAIEAVMAANDWCTEHADFILKRTSTSQLVLAVCKKTGINKEITG